MTEQERPRTEAGRALMESPYRPWSAFYDADICRAILAIETEGRQQHEHDPDACDDCMAMVEEAMRD